MRYQKEITLEVHNEEPDKKRQFTPEMSFGTKPSSLFLMPRSITRL
jgi:hypothetical protein